MLSVLRAWHLAGSPFVEDALDGPLQLPRAPLYGVRALMLGPVFFSSLGGE